METKLLNAKNFAKTLNDYTFTLYYIQLSLIAKSIFEYENLPESISEKYLEECLFEMGECVFYKEKEIGKFIVSKTAKQGLDYQLEPINLIPVNNNIFTNKTLDNNVNAVLIRNNDMSIPTNFITKLYAYKIADTSRTIDINVNAQKTPIIIITNDKQKLVMKNVFNQYTGNEPLIVADKSGDIQNSFSVLKSEAPIVFDKLQEYKGQIFNEYLSWLGINTNPTQDKKERVNTLEVSSNNEQVLACFNTMFKARKMACDKINEIFGLNIRVKKRIDFEVILEDMNDSEDDSEEGYEEGSKGFEKEVS